MQDKQYIEEDEIDLRELFKSIWDKKTFIIIFTGVVTLLAIVYALMKTPIYEVKSVVRIGYIGENLVENSNILEKKLRIIFNVDNKQTMTKENAIVSNISAVKKVDNFLEISTQGFSNEKAIKKNNEVVSFLQNEYKYKIDEYILRTKIAIKDLEDKVNYINSVDKINLQKNIEKIKIQSIPKIDQKIRLIKTQDIPKIDQKIKFLTKVELKSLENKLLFNKTKLKEYEDIILKISKQKSSDNTQNMLISMQLLNTQNLILNLQNSIENILKDKETILNISLKDLEIQKQNMNAITLKDLEIQKQNLIDENIRKLNIKLNVDLVNNINNINDSIELEKLKLTNNFTKNSEIIGQIKVLDNPIKPKKALIIVVAFVTGFILSIFLVFFMQFFRSMRKEEIR